MNNEEQKTKGRKVYDENDRKMLIAFDFTSKNVIKLDEAAKLLREIVLKKTDIKEFLDNDEVLAQKVDSIITEIEKIEHEQDHTKRELFEKITGEDIFTTVPDNLDELKECPNCGEPLTILPNEKEWTTKFCRNCPWNITKNRKQKVKS